MKERLHKSKLGFTLTELIIVIVIIGILAAVLIPSLTQYIERARDAAAVQEASPYVTALSTYNIEYSAGSYKKTFEEYCQEYNLSVDTMITLDKIVNSPTSPVSYQVNANLSAASLDNKTDGFLLWAKNNRLIAYNHLLGNTDLINLNKEDLKFGDSSNLSRAIKDKVSFLNLKAAIDGSRGNDQEINFNLSAMVNGDMITTDSTIATADIVFTDLNSTNLTCSVGNNQSLNVSDVLIPSFYYQNGVKYEVTKIANNAFGGTSGNSTLEKITIANSIESIGDEAFSNCSNLAEVVFKKDAKLASIGKKAFASSKITSIDLPTTITSLGESVFENCESLTGLVIPEGVTTIGKNIVDGCKELVSLQLPASLISIGDELIGQTKELTTIKVAQTNPTYQSLNDNTLVKIIDTDTEEEPNDLLLVHGTVNTVIGENIVEISADAFKGYDTLKTLQIPSEVTKINEGAFEGCNQLTLYFVATNSSSADLNLSDRPAVWSCEFNDDGSIKSFGSYTKTNDSLNDPARDGFKFNGWSSDEHWGGELIQSSNLTTGEGKKFAVWYDSNNPYIEVMADSKVIARIEKGSDHSSLSSLESLTTVDNSTFIGWSNSKDTISLIDADTTLGDKVYAVYIKDVEITFTLMKVEQEQSQGIQSDELEEGTETDDTDTIYNYTLEVKAILTTKPSEQPTEKSTLTDYEASFKTKVGENEYSEFGCDEITLDNEGSQITVNSEFDDNKTGTLIITITYNNQEYSQEFKFTVENGEITINSETESD